MSFTAELGAYNGSGTSAPGLLKHREPMPPYATSHGYSNHRQARPYSASNLKVTVPNSLYKAPPLRRPASAVTTTTRPLETIVSKKAPYASRLIDCFHTMTGPPSGAGILSQYNTLSDPHLHDYYFKKFSNIPVPPSSRPGSGRRRPMSASRTRSARDIGSRPKDCTYKISVTTGDKKGAGTDAKVSLTLKGARGKLPKQLLSKPSKINKKKKTKIKFLSKSTTTFKITGKDIGDMTSIFVEHDGVQKSQSWFLERIEVVKRLPSGLEKMWVFVCGEWLSLHHAPYKTGMELFAKKYSKTEYEVITVTGNQKGAGTDANVFVTLYGKGGQTPKLQLKNNSKNCFEREQSDIFNLKATSVGPLVKARIQHDNQGFGPGWFLDRIVVTDKNHPKNKFYFPCGHWLAKDEEDGLICRDLIGSKDPLATMKPNKYKVTVYTGDKRGAGTDANVYITLFGEMGDSGERKLDTSSNNFERLSVDEFILESAALGQIQRVRIGHDNWGPAPGWYLDKVIIDDMDNNVVAEFPCGRWFSKSEEDGAISRDLIRSTGPMDAPPGFPYEIKVSTGDVSNAGTSARVYIVMYGGNEGTKNSGKIWLEGGNFTRSRTDIFNIEVADMLSPLHHIEIGHDDSGTGAGWFLDKIVINCPSAGIEQSFMCDKWLATDEGDGLIERILYESGRKKRKKLNTWHVWVHTSDVNGGGTDAGVNMVVYGKTKDGDYLRSDDVPLGSKGDAFEAGEVDRFKVDFEEIGRPYKVRIFHDGKGMASGWHLDKIELEHMVSKKHYTFPCNRWLARSEDDGHIIREMPAEGDDIKKPQPMSKYRCAVHTGDKRGAGTDADVFMAIYGEQGDTGERPLLKSATNRNKFERGNVDEFEIEAVTLKQMKKIRIGHNSKRPGDGWFLDKVVVTDQLDNASEVFECGRWLDVNEDDGLIVREITTGGSQMLNTTSYHVSVKTGDCRGAGTDADVFIKLFGAKQSTSNVALRSAEHTKDKFERARTDLFKIEAADIGKIDKIRIGHDGSNPGSGWFLDEIRIDVPSSGESYVFAAHRWLDSDEGDGQIELDIEPTDYRKGTAKIPYEVTVWTSDVRGAGTDANVFLQMYGENGKTEQCNLRNRTDNFEQGQMDKFKIEAEDVGPLLKVRIGHDAKGFGAGWHLAKMLIQRHASKKSRKRRMVRRKSSSKLITRGEVITDDEDDKSGRKRRSVSEKRYNRDDSDEDEYNRGGGGRRKSRYDDPRQRSLSRGRYDDGGYGSDDSLERRPSSARRGSSMPSERDGRRKSSAAGRRKSMFHGDSDLSDDMDDRHSERRGGNRRPSSAVRRKSTYDRKYDSDDDLEDGRSDRRQSSVGRRKSLYQGKYDSDDDMDERRSDKSGRRKSMAPPSSRRKIMHPGRDESEEDERSSRRKSSAGRRKSLYHHESDMEVDSDSNKSGNRGRRKSSAIRKRTGSRDDSHSDDERSKSSRGKKKSYIRQYSDDEDKSGRRRSKSRGDDQEESVEEYWFVCNRWFATNEDDKKIVRELLPTDETGRPLDTGLKEIAYSVKVVTGDVWGAGTDANVFITITGEHGDSGERDLKESSNRNKFERKQEDIFEVKAVELGKISNVKIRHDNKGGGAAWFLDYVEITDPRSKKTIFFPCQRWLATDKDDGQIYRVLVPADHKLKSLGSKGAQAIRDEIALEAQAAMTIYHVHVVTGDKFGAGTDANVYIHLYGEDDDTGQLFLKSSLTHRNKFERNQTDEFTLETMNIGDLKKIKIGHDNSGIGGGAWFLEHVVIDCPSQGKKWLFQCGRWLAKNEDDGLLERELYPQEDNTEEYVPCVPYEIKVYTSDVRGAGTDADVYVQLYGKDMCTKQKSLCGTKKDRKALFERKQCDQFIVQLEDVGKTIEKIRVGHDGSGYGAGWHLNKIEVRRLKEGSRRDSAGSETHTFLCNRWLASDEDDGAIVRELVAERVTMETTRNDGSIKKKELKRKDTLSAKKYDIDVITGDVSGSGTNANVFLTLFGDKGDSGERKLAKSDTHMDKFERNNTDKFHFEAMDLGKLFKVHIRHDNSSFSPAWFLDSIEVSEGRDKVVFHCERWLAKNKDDGKISRTLYVKGYEGDMSSTSTLRSGRHGSMGSMESSREPFSKSPRSTKKTMEDIPEGPTIPYTVSIVTGDSKDHGTESNVYIKIFGRKNKHTGKQYLELAQKSGFLPGSRETFSLEAPELHEVTHIELGHDGVTEGSGWYVKEVDVDMPTKGKRYFFNCKQWLAKDKDDGKIVRTFKHMDDSSSVSYKPKIPYELTIHTGDMKDAGTDSQVFVKLFGSDGASTELPIDKKSDRFERARSDIIKIEFEDVGRITKLRIGHDGKGHRPEWYVEKVDLLNLNTLDMIVFKAGFWFSNSKGDNKTMKDLVAIVDGKAQLKKTTYRVRVKTSDQSGAGTGANVFLIIFGENGDTGELRLDKSDSKNMFDRNQTDNFVFADILNLGQLLKLRIWHDNKGFGSSWHLASIEVEDQSTGKKFQFSCNRWLSKSEDDKQICRELTCDNLSSPSTNDKITYDIAITTTDKQEAGMSHHAWLILEGDQRISKELVMENSSRTKLFKKGQTDDGIKLVSRNLGSLDKCILGAVERHDKPLPRGSEGRSSMWHCHQVIVTNRATKDRYEFPCKAWIPITSNISKKNAKVLSVKNVQEGRMSVARKLGTVKYEILVTTSDISGAGTDANVFVTLYGSDGQDSGKRALTGSTFRNLFERKQLDTFQIEAVDLGNLTKLKIEHDNSSFFKSAWHLDNVEVKNMGSNHRWMFPCQRWLDKKKGDGQIAVELLPRD